MRPSKPGLPLRTTLFYLLFGCLWILLSDQLLSRIIFYDLEQTLYQTLKGWFYVLISGAFLFILLRQDFAQHTRTEQALRESEERFRLMFENNPAIMMLIEPISGEIKTANRAAAAFYGYPLSRLSGMNINEINQLSPEEVESERFRALREERKFFNFQHRLSSGEVRTVEVHSAPIKIADDTLLFSIIYDATERSKAQQELAQVQSRMKGIVESAMDAIISVDSNHEIILANPAAEQMFGYGPGDLLGKPLEWLLPERFRQVHHEHVQQFGTTGVTTRSMHTLGAVYGLYAGGDEFPIEASISQISVGSEKVFTVILRDITERKQAEDRIRHQLQRLRALHDIDIAISSSFDMHTSLDVLLEEARIQLGVDAAAVFLLEPASLTLHYAAGKGFRSAAIRFTHLPINESAAGRAVIEKREIHLEDLSQADDIFLRREVWQSDAFTSYFVTPLIAKGEAKGVLELYHRSTLQTTPEWLDFLRILAGQAAIAVENAQLFEHLRRSNLDLERRVQERTTELNQTNHELARANRSKDEFLATMSHELRTPLNSILGLSESLLEERRGTLNEHQQNALHIIESSGHHLLELINDILDLSKIEAGMFKLYLEPIPVEDFCKSCLAFVGSQAIKKSITLTYTNESPVPRILADPRRLKQILTNLLINAVKFTPPHGEVELHITGDTEADLIQFSVIDTGIGIAREDLQKLFQPFVQVDSGLNRQHPGTGLGLALVQKLTDLHGGSVTVESEVGRGSRFTVNLPYRSAEVTQIEYGTLRSLQLPASEEITPAFGTPVSNRNPVILLAEDNLPNVLTIGEYLEVHGFELVIAHNGVEALAKAEERGPDLILMDIQMPVKSGLDAMSQLRADPRFASIPIIALTALAMPGDRERCLQAGANEYMSKPVSLKSLLQMITRFLENRNKPENV